MRISSFPAHPEAFLDFSKCRRSDGVIWNMSGIVERHLHEVFPQTHHRNLDTGARDLKILKQQLEGFGVVQYDSR